MSSADSLIFDRATEAAQHLQTLVPTELKAPAAGIICGSGLGGLADSIDDEPRAEVAYVDIPHFPQVTVHGHAGKLVFGLLGSKKTPVVLMVGRAHYYEGNSIDKITFPVRVLKLLGVETIIVTNAAGGLNRDYAVGDIVVLNDHLNLIGLVGIHPLRGPNMDEFGIRFPALSDAYDLALRKMTHQAWKKRGLDGGKRRIHEGVYAFELHDETAYENESFETRAECRMLHGLGADVVGMSTVPEIIVARHCGLRVLAFSLVTNISVLDAGPKGNDIQMEFIEGKDLNRIIEIGKANHVEVLGVGDDAAKDMQALVEQVVTDHDPSSKT
ncbi:MAG: hypothetical protein M1816_005183 [Peltula sp. TS41687]|nr:MAG: hypothetical protein M1816_005183 [Peltula sp. TS41687]